jgi:hypothetical protein
MLVNEGMKEFSDYRNIGLGVILAALVILLPQGVVGALAALWRCRRHVTIRSRA